MMEIDMPSALQLVLGVVYKRKLGFVSVRAEAYFLLVVVAVGGVILLLP